MTTTHVAEKKTAAAATATATAAATTTADAKEKKVMKAKGEAPEAFVDPDEGMYADTSSASSAVLRNCMASERSSSAMRSVS